MASTSTQDRTPTALITGAAHGIGKAIALRLASDGFNIAINDIPSKEELLNEVAKEIRDRYGKKTAVVPCDVSEEGPVKEMIAKTAEVLGGLDVMVANAGICITKPILQTEVSDWNKIMDVNAKSVFLCYKYAAEQMIKQGVGGRIIGASSVAGKRGTCAFPIYCASKFAVRGLTQAAAEEWGPHGITVNAYAPGYVETPLTYSCLIPGVAPNPGDFLKLGTTASVLGRVGTPDDIAAMVAYLASKGAGFVTGQTLSINGGTFYD